MDPNAELAREIAYHDELYSGFAQRHFAKPAVRALRAHMARRILERTGASSGSRVLSAGCGIGDTELLLAPHVGSIVGIDASPAAIAQAERDAAAGGIRNFEARVGRIEDLGDERFDAVIAVFFLHHLSESALAAAPRIVARLLKPGGVFYALDPSRDRLSGRIGERLFPRLMRRYQSPGERPLDPVHTTALFREAAFEASYRFYDFVSSPLAGLLPSWRAGYRMARLADELLIRTPGLRRWGSNFELLARNSDRARNG